MIISTTKCNQRFRCTDFSNNSARQSGFSLVELLVATVIGLGMIGGLATTFSGTRLSSELNSTISDMQESARFALDSIARDTRMGGFQGCIDLNRSRARIIADTAPTDNIFETAVTGSIIKSATNWSPAPPDDFVIPSTDITPIKDSHTLSIQFGNPQTYRLQPMTNLNDDIVLMDEDGNVEKQSNIEPNDLILISNCQSADLVKVTAINNGTIKHSISGNDSDNLFTNYGVAGERNMPRVMKFESNVYYVADTGRNTESGDDITSLYRQTLPFTSPPQEMVEGVEHFRVKFGVVQPGSDNMQWMTADQVGSNFGNVHSVQIGMLMVSLDPVNTQSDNRTYRIAGERVVPESTGTNANTLTHAADRRIRMAYNTTVNIRNRREQ